MYLLNVFSQLSCVTFALFFVCPLYLFQMKLLYGNLLKKSNTFYIQVWPFNYDSLLDERRFKVVLAFVGIGVYYHKSNIT